MGVCSNYLCDAKPGDEIKLTGPSGKVMLMPEDDPNMTYIMVATGTGIAPFRSFLRRLFGEATPAGKNFKGLAWLFLGVANKDALLYDEEFQVYLRQNPDKMRMDYALSREGPPTRRVARCTSRTRLRSTPTRCSTPLTRVPTCTSAAEGYDAWHPGHAQG